MLLGTTDGWGPLAPQLRCASDGTWRFCRIGGFLWCPVEWRIFFSGVPAILPGNVLAEPEKSGSPAAEGFFVDG